MATNYIVVHTTRSKPKVDVECRLSTNIWDFTKTDHECRRKNPLFQGDMEKINYTLTETVENVETETVDGVTTSEKVVGSKKTETKVSVVFHNTQYVDASKQAQMLQLIQACKGNDTRRDCFTMVGLVPNLVEQAKGKGPITMKLFNLKPGLRTGSTQDVAVDRKFVKIDKESDSHAESILNAFLSNPDQLMGFSSQASFTPHAVYLSDINEDGVLDLHFQLKPYDARGKAPFIDVISRK